MIDAFERNLYGVTARALAPEPLEVRVLDRLTAVIVLTDELLTEFQSEDARALLWLEPHVRRVYDDVDSLMTRLAQ